MKTERLLSLIHISHGHDLLKQLRDPLAVKIIVRHGAHPRQLFLLPDLIKYVLSRFYFIFCNLTAHIHPLFVKLHDTAVDPVDFFSQLL